MGKNKGKPSGQTRQSREGLQQPLNQGIFWEGEPPNQEPQGRPQQGQQSRAPQGPQRGPQPGTPQRQPQNREQQGRPQQPRAPQGKLHELKPGTSQRQPQNQGQHFAHQGPSGQFDQFASSVLLKEQEQKLFQPLVPIIQQAASPSAALDFPPLMTAKPLATPGAIVSQPLSQVEQSQPLLEPNSKAFSALSLGPEQLSWDKSTRGSFNNPYRTTQERMKAKGTKGRKIKILANHFPINVLCEQVYRYDVKFKVAEWKRDVQRKDKNMLIRAIEILKKQYSGKVFPPDGGCSTVFDGMSSLYAAKQLKLDKAGGFKASVSTYPDEDEAKVVNIAVKIDFNGTFPLKAALDHFLSQGAKGAVQPSEPIQILNIILSYGVYVDPSKHVMIGRKCFQPDNKGRVEQIDVGKFLWLGTFESVRVGWKLSLNVDMANKPAYEKDDLINYIGNYLHSRRKPNEDMLALVRLLKTDRDAFAVADNEIRDLKARFLRPDGAKRDYRMVKLTKSPRELKMDKNGEKMTLERYYLSEYNYQIKYPDLPCVHVGNPKNQIYIPMELLELKRQVCPQSKILSEDATRNMIKITAVKPDERQKRIKENLKSRHDTYKKDPYAQGFGITVQDNFASIDGRVLDPPTLSYNTQQNQGTVPRDGKWAMPSRSQFMECKDLVHWGVLDRCGLRRNDLEGFIRAILKEADAMGMKTEKPAIEQSRGLLEKEFKAFHQKLNSPSIIMVICPFKNGDDYATIKLLGDSELKMPTQFVLKKNVFGKNQGPPSPATIHNIVLKLNSKLGGTNQVLAPNSKQEIMVGPVGLFQRPIMVMGADVTHPAPGMQNVKPSIAAIVGSYDAAVSRYFTEVRIQWGKVGQATVEQIMDMEEVTRRLLLKFYNINRQRKPEKIVFYRDGVSEGQFEMVLNKELAAIQRACTKLEPGYQPGITYFVAQKRHHTRLFPQNPKDGLRNGNVPPGTVVDVDITYPTVSSFFLASHEGIQGTTRPTYYVKLSDDNNLSSDTEQALTYFLCHLYSRCERSVSYPAPTYYAHLAAFRAREHHNALLKKYGVDGSNSQMKEELSKMEEMSLVNYFV